MRKIFERGRSDYLAMGKECAYCGARAVLVIRHKHRRLPNKYIAVCDQHVANGERATGWAV